MLTQVHTVLLSGRQKKNILMYCRPPPPCTAVIFFLSCRGAAVSQGVENLTFWGIEVIETGSCAIIT